MTTTTDTTNAAGSLDETLTYEHGRLATRSSTRPQGDEVTIDYAYNPAGELQTAATTVDGSTSTDEYQYLETGSVDWVKRNGVLHDYSYDDARQLTSIEGPDGTQSFGYDALGRRTSAQWVDGTELSTGYDLLGYQSDAEVTAPGGVHYTEQLEHDATGVLSAVSQTGVLFPGDVVRPVAHDLVWDRLDPVPRVVEAHNPAQVTSIYWAGSQAYGVSNNDTAGTSAYDALGNPVLNGTGVDASVRTPELGPYGEWSQRTMPTMGRGFQGEIFLPDGLVALRARNYDANTQSFTTRDPLAGVVGSNNLTNPYHYADNDPINRHDPLGLRGEQKDPCGTSWADKWITDNVLSHFDDSKCFNSGTGARAVKESWPTILALSGAGGCVAASSASLFVAAPVCLGVFGLLGGGGQAAHDCGKKLTECGDEILLGAKSGGAAGLAAGLTIAAGALTGAPIVLVAGFASGNAAWAGASVAGRGFSAADYRNNFLLGMGVAVAVEGLGYAARGMKTIGGKALESTRTIASERNWGTSVKTLVADEAGSARLPFGREPTAAPATTPSGEQLHDIPTGSRGGVGSGNPIPRSLRDEWFPDGQAPPACSYCRTRPGSTLDHVEPKSLGGDLTPDNITPACPRCNSSKGARVAPKTPPAEYVGPWPPPHWPQPMKDWWNQTYGGGS